MFNFKLSASQVALKQNKLKHRTMCSPSFYISTKDLILTDLPATSVSYNIKVSRNVAPTWYHLQAEKPPMYSTQNNHSTSAGIPLALL